MEWLQKLREKFEAGASHAFVLYLNIADDFLGKDGRTNQLRYLLAESEPFNGFHFVAFFNRGTGVVFPSEEMESRFTIFLNKWDLTRDAFGRTAAEQFEANRADIGYVRKLFSKLLQLSVKNGKKSEELFKELDEKYGRKNSFLAFIVEFAETYAPSDAACDRPEDRDALVTFLVWARDQKIHEARNAIVFVADTLSALAPALRSEANRITPLKIPFPNRNDRLQIIEKLHRDFPDCQSGVTAETFAHLSSGMTNFNLTQLCREANHSKTPLTESDIFKAKKKALEEQSGGLIEIVKPLWGLRAIGALDEQKKYITEVAEAFRTKNVMAVPMGILLLGAQGTGKTVFVEALAYELGVPVIKPKNLREMWVGQSERNQELFIELAIANEPCIAFLDELDQQVQMRGAVFHGDGGVSARMQSRLFEVMSDTNLRGKLLWIAASNRPDLIDVALIREGRFDEKIPFFPPTMAERALILPAILHKMQMQAQAAGRKFQWDINPDFMKEFGKITHRHLNQDNEIIKCGNPDIDHEDEIGFTGAEIEVVVRKAYALASFANRPVAAEHLLQAVDDFILSRNIREFDNLSELALRHCNSKRFVPEGKWRKKMGQQPTRTGGTGQYL